MNLLGLAIAITSEVFKDTLDKGGHPYILHCMRVMNKVQPYGTTAMICGVLHDVVEDSPDKYSFEKLEMMGFDDVVILNLRLLTHSKSEPYHDYIKRLSVSAIAREVKMADLEDNSSITRLKGVEQKDFERMQKYLLSYTYLKQAKQDERII